MEDYIIKRITDIIKEQDYAQWKPGDIITIQAQTDSGKSHFILNTLYEYAKRHNRKIAYLVNRDLLRQQINEIIIEGGKEQTIFIFTYQSLEKPLLYGHNKSLLNGYYYIVADEFHYFMNDATFNNKTDLSFNHIMSKASSCRILMSATSDLILSYMKTKGINTIDYLMERERDNIEKLYFSFHDEVIKKYLIDIPDDEKVIYFVHNLERAYELHKEYINSIFMCSRNNKRYKHKLDTSKIDSIIENSRFEEKYLFCTTALDNGVNLKDEKIKHIVVDIKDLDSLVQCIGRKRMAHDNDKITLIIKAINGRVMNAMRNGITRTIKMADDLENGINSSEFIKKYPRTDNGHVIFDTANSSELNSISKSVNDVTLYKYRSDINKYIDILNENKQFKKGKDKLGYINHVLKLLKREDYTMLENEYDAVKVSDHLEKLVGKKMFKDDQEKFKEWFKNNLVNAPKNTNGTVGLKTLNMFLKENKYNYKIYNKKEYKGADRGETYWMVV